MDTERAAASVTPVTLRTADGHHLAGDLVVPPTPTIALVVTHPHPRFGGDRANAVVVAIERAGIAAGAATLRFDFRGVRAPDAHDEGRAEHLDVVAALDAMAAAAPSASLVIVGYSFGAAVGLGVDDERLTGWVAVAPPLGPGVVAATVRDDARPKRLLVPEHDQFCPPAAARQATTGWANTSIETVVGADHLLHGHTAHVATRAVTAARTLVP